MNRHREIDVNRLRTAAPLIESGCCGGRPRVEFRQPLENPVRLGPPGLAQPARALPRVAAIRTALAVANASGPPGSAFWRVALRTAVRVLNAGTRIEEAKVDESTLSTLLAGDATSRASGEERER